jgi:hypothetical protein
MRKNKLYSELSLKQRLRAESAMGYELRGLDYKHPIRTLHMLAWETYKTDGFTYDGPTFAKRRHAETDFEIAALIHDWRNSFGYVGKDVDREMFNIMISLNYPYELIVQRYWLTRFTFLNVIRHWIKGTLKNSTPKNLYHEITL